MAKSKSNNKSLGNAKTNKIDEFYTQLSDIEAEMRHYKDHFVNKVVFCNCDDPYESNFFKYFAMNFNYLKLKKLVATCYTGSPIVGEQLSLFEVVGLENNNNSRRPYKIEISEVTDENSDGAIDLTDVEFLLKNKKNILTLLDGDGDFRSDESIELLKKSDIVVTNPPFSLFREYVEQLFKYKKKFIIIGSKNALTYKEIFKHIRDDEMWLGHGFANGNAYFSIPEKYINNFADGVYDKKTGLVKFRNVGWYTNLDLSKRHENLTLFKNYDSTMYQRYDNYDAINIDKVANIPYDYDGVMGVPITFLDNYNPNQFKIIGLIAGNIRGLAGITSSIGKDGPYINGKLKYGRILIKRIGATQ